ncbi:MAG: NAD(P)/FAD-dependent oxidoreductase [Opitutales bacterium]|nr:NAD(P)/FAD-dependent oxidoreductase [Opitutales bacterium]
MINPDTHTGEPADIAIVGGGLAGTIAALKARCLYPRATIDLLEREDEPLAWLNRFIDEPLALGWAGDDPDAFAHVCLEGSEPLRSLFVRMPGSGLRDELQALDINLREQDGAWWATQSGAEVGQSLRAKLGEARIRLRLQHHIEEVAPTSDGWRLWSRSFPPVDARRLLWTTGGSIGRTVALFETYGHTYRPFFPGCFALRVADARLKGLAGICQADAMVTLQLPGQAPTVHANGTLRVSGKGLEGTALIKASAELAATAVAAAYQIRCTLDWMPGPSAGDLLRELTARKQSHGKRPLAEDPLWDTPAKLWTRWLKSARIDERVTWSAVPGRKLNALISQIKAPVFDSKGHTLDRHERSHGGGLAWDRLDPTTLASRERPRLHFAGECLDYMATPYGPHSHIALATALIATQSTLSP